MEARTDIKHLMQALRQALAPAPRASLHGLEVSDSTFGEWLAAGGERRQRPRPAPAPARPR